MGRTERRAYSRASAGRAARGRPGLRVWVASFAFAAVGLGMLVGSGVEARAAFSLRDNGVATQAEIVAIHQAKGSECEVVYQDSTGAAHWAWLDNQCHDMATGQSIPVKYLASDPGTVAAFGTLSLTYILINKSGLMFVGLVIFAFGGVGILACVGVIPSSETRRRSQLSDARPE